MNQRLEKVREILKHKKIDGITINGRANTFWLSGFTGTTSLILVTSSKAFLIVDFRYIIQAKTQAASGFTVVELKGSFISSLENYCFINKVKQLGFESDVLTVTGYEQYREKLRTPNKYINISLELTELRLIKDYQEIDAIRHAAFIGDCAFKDTIPYIKEHVTESELAAELEYRIRKYGAKGCSFDTIIASGYNSALCHATVSDKSIEWGDAIVFDFGVKWDGYCSDMTRTVFLGEPCEQLKQLYFIVKQAQEAVVESVTSNMNGREADAIARNIITDAGYGSYFGHSVGHGVGIEIHENPRLSAYSEDMLENGTVFTIEPGIYIEGIGGVRIEDMGMMDGGRFVAFTSTTKELLIL